MTFISAIHHPDYALAGWRFRSEIPIEALPAWDGDADRAPDLVLMRGNVAEVECDDDPVEVVVTGRDFATVVVADAGRFAVRSGSQIVADVRPDALPGVVENTIVGPVLGTLCYQRKIVPLHCNTVVIDGQAVALSGKSGAGKSTLAAILLKRGHRLISDDVLPLCEADGRTFALPGTQHLRLWGQTLDLIGEDKAGLRRAADGAREKYYLPTVEKTTSRFPLAALIWLERSDKDDHVLRPCNGVFRTRAIWKATYGSNLIREFSKMGSKEVANLSLPGVAVYDLLRPRKLEHLEEQADMIEKLVTSGGVAGGGPSTELKAARR
jgi:hypothetical protein